MSVSHSDRTLAVIGECMAELTQQSRADMRLGYGGDVMNTAIYCKRLLKESATISFVSVMGDDELSKNMMKAWQEEGIDLSACPTLADKTIGLYIVHNHIGGERTFQYWRSDSAARYLMVIPQIDAIFDQLRKYNAVYLSGISLAILPEADRQKLIEKLHQLKQCNTKIIFDSNYRAHLWQSQEKTKSAFEELYRLADLLLLTFEDEQIVWGDTNLEAIVSRLGRCSNAEIVIKSGAEGCYYLNPCHAGQNIQKFSTEPVSHVVDTTAAGDSFNAGYLSGWLQGKSPEQCAKAGNRLAGQVIQHKGAIVPIVDDNGNLTLP